MICKIRIEKIKQHFRCGKRYTPEGLIQRNTAVKTNSSKASKLFLFGIKYLIMPVERK
jgi:hypothetical protein